MALQFFSVTGNLTAVVVDYVNDSDQDPDEVKVTATVRFIPRVPRGQLIWAPGLVPSQGIILSTVQARFDEDGYLRTIQNQRQNEVQLVSVTGTQTGSFPLTFNGSTATIPFTSTPAAMQTALAALPGIGVGNVQVGGNVGAWQVQFTGTLSATDVGTMTTTNTNVHISTLKTGALNAGVELVANTADIAMDQLIYDVVFSQINYRGMPDDFVLDSFAFAAPTSSVTIDLSQLEKLPPAPGL